MFPRFSLLIQSIHVFSSRLQFRKQKRSRFPPRSQNGGWGGGRPTRGVPRVDLSCALRFPCTQP
uniref:Uncharacterized protein n=1 Tax=Rhizophora mucronata TaxID=61149 RepID=A0A2P2J1C9_RHIMU